MLDRRCARGALRENDPFALKCCLDTLAAEATAAASEGDRLLQHPPAAISRNARGECCVGVDMNVGGGWGEQRPAES